MNKTKGISCEYPECQRESEKLCYFNDNVSYLCQIHLNSHLQIAAPEHPSRPPDILDPESLQSLLSKISSRRHILSDLEIKLFSAHNTLISSISDHFSTTLTKLHILKQDLDNYQTYILNHHRIFSDLIPSLSWPDCSESIDQNLNLETLQLSISEFFNKDFTQPGLPHIPEPKIFEESLVDFRLSLQTIQCKTKSLLLAFNQIILPVHDDDPSVLFYSPRTKMVVAGYKQGRLRMFNANQTQVLVTLEISTQIVQCISESSDSEFIIVGLNGELIIFKPGTADSRHRERDVGSITEICAARDPRVFVTSNYDGTLKCWRIVGDGLVEVWQGVHTNANAFLKTVWCIDISQDDRYAVSGDCGGCIKIWNRGGGALVREARIHKGKVKCLVVCKGSQKVVSVGENKLLHVWNLRIGNILWSVKIKDTILGLKNSLNGEVIIAAGEKKVVAWDLERGQQVLMLAYS